MGMPIKSSRKFEVFSNQQFEKLKRESISKLDELVIIKHFYINILVYLT